MPRTIGFSNTSFGFVLLIGFCVLTSRPAASQMIRNSLPFTTVNDSFYERIGIDFGFSLRGTPATQINDRTRGVFGLGPGGQLQPNLRFTQGSVNSAVPPFGGYDPAADATFGYNYQNGNGGYHLGLRMGKGNSRTLTNTTPVMMNRNGVTGNIFSGSVSPFVTGVVPVVGHSSVGIPGSGPVRYIHPLENRLKQMHLSQLKNSGSGIESSPDRFASLPERQFGKSESSATRGDLSVKEIKRLRAQQLLAEDTATNSKADEFAAKADAAFQKGLRGAARSYLRTAIRYATGSRKDVLQKKLDQWLLIK